MSQIVPGCLPLWEDQPFLWRLAGGRADRRKHRRKYTGPAAGEWLPVHHLPA